MLLSPYFDTRLVTLQPTSARDGPQLWHDLSELDASGLPGVTLFTDLYCPVNVVTIATQFTVTSNPGDQLVGCSTLFKLDAHAGHVRAGVFVAPGATGSNLLEHASLLTVNYAFAIWNIRKVYLWRVAQTSSPLASLATLEGVLHEYLCDGPELLDLEILSIYRTAWDSSGAAALEHARQPHGAAG